MYKTLTQLDCSANLASYKLYDRCEIPILAFKEASFKGDDYIYAIVRACNSGGCSQYSQQNNQNYIQAGYAPTIGVNNLKIADETNWKEIKLVWDGINYETDSGSGKNPIDYKIEYQVTSNPQSSVPTYDNAKNLTLSTY